MAAERLPSALDPTTKYSLVVVGDVFKNKSDVVRGRLARELRNAVADHLRVPVAGPEEIPRAARGVGPQAIGRLVVGLVLVLLVYVLISAIKRPFSDCSPRETPCRTVCWP